MGRKRRKQSRANAAYRVDSKYCVAERELDVALISSLHLEIDTALQLSLDFDEGGHLVIPLRLNRSQGPNCGF